MGRFTREEQRSIRETSKQLDALIRSSSKAYGYKKVSGFVYKFVDERVYVIVMMVLPSVATREIVIDLYVKPFLLDELFWDVFKLEEARKKPKSFHVDGVYTVPLLEVSHWSESLSDTNEMSTVFGDNLHKTDQMIVHAEQKLQTISFFDAFAEKSSSEMLYRILGYMQEKSYQQALVLLEAEIAAGESGGSYNESGGSYNESGQSFYECAHHYCLERL